MINFFWKKNLASSLRALQENDAKFRFAMHPQGIRQFHDNCKIIAKCQTVAILAPVYHFDMLKIAMSAIYILTRLIVLFL